MKKISLFSLVGLLLAVSIGAASVSAASSRVSCGVGKWKQVLKLDVGNFYRPATVVKGNVAQVVDAHNQGCEVRVKYRYQYLNAGSERKGNRLYTCAFTAVNEFQPETSSLDCYSPLWFGRAEDRGPQLWSEVVSLGQTDEFPDEASVGVTLFEAHKDVQSVTELFPSTASGTVEVFVKK